MNRRLFLKQLGGAALALPLLQVPAGAQTAPFPRRLVIFFTPNGTKKELWSPGKDATETRFTPGPLLAPVLPFKDRLVLFDGVDSKVGWEGPGGPHLRGMACLLTGHIIRPGDYADGDGRRAGWAGGVSVDQYAAEKLRPPTALRSLELGVRVVENEPRSRIIYRGADQPVPPENDPASVYARLFKDFEGDPEELRRRLKRRQSVLDRVFQDFQRLEGRLATADRVKLQHHAEALRELERRLGTIVERPATCEPVVPGAPLDTLAERHFREVLRAQADLLVMSLACDVTRFASLQCSSAVNAMRFTFLDLEQDGHSLSHAGDGSATQQDQWERMLVWYAEQFAYLLGRLDAVPEGDGTLLDHTLVLWVNELSRGNTHDLNDLPFLLAGGGAFLRTGRYLRYDGASHNDLLLSVLHLLGVEDTSFGNPEFCTGPLAGLA